MATGMNVRDWLYVEDHCEAIRSVLAEGRVGEIYNIGGRSEKPNLEIVNTDLLDSRRTPPRRSRRPPPETDHLREGPSRP